MNATNDSDVEALATLARHLMAVKMFSLACCVMLFYDILITFGDEVEKIWKQRFSFATVLWFMNRYLSPLGYIVVIVSFHDNWPKSVCNRYVLFPEVLKIFTSTAIGVIFALRLYSIYGGSMTVLVTVAVLLVVELAVKIWAFTDGTSINLPPGLVGCILTGKSNSDDRFVFTWIAELIFDSLIFIATLSRTLLIYKRHRQGAAIPLIKIMMRDGIIYFLVIFAANVVTVTLFLTLTADLKAVNASFSTLITSLMVSRLILNLRNQAMRPRAAVVSMSYPSSQVLPDQSLMFQSQYQYQSQDEGEKGEDEMKREKIPSTMIGNLGEPVEANWFDDDDFGGDKGDDGYYGGDTYAMKNLYDVDYKARARVRRKRKHIQMQKQQQYASGKAAVSDSHSSRPGPGQIIVEVTQTRSVTADCIDDHWLTPTLTPTPSREDYECAHEHEYGSTREDEHGRLGPSIPYAYACDRDSVSERDALGVNSAMGVGVALSCDREHEHESEKESGEPVPKSGRGREDRSRETLQPLHASPIANSDPSLSPSPSLDAKRTLSHSFTTGNLRSKTLPMNSSSEKTNEGTVRSNSGSGETGMARQGPQPWSEEPPQGEECIQRPNTTAGTGREDKGTPPRVRVQMKAWQPPASWLLENADAGELGGEPSRKSQRQRQGQGHAPLRSEGRGSSRRPSTS